MKSHPDDDLLLELALQELDDAARAEVEKHLTGCAECAQTARAFRTIAAAARDTTAREAPAGPLAALLEAQAGARLPWWRGRVPAWAAAAVVAVAVAAGFWAGRQTGGAAPEPTGPVPPAETAGAPRELPTPPRIPFASA